jgi:glycolate oxidase iron-sulfur subunit
VQTFLPQALQDTDAGREADAILRTCVHCGFCNATCPTYQLLGDERDGPRGRIYLIKEMLEHGRATRETQIHLDRCLTCRACETTCPSGVNYHRLLEIGRAVMEELVPRSPGGRLQRAALLRTVPEPDRLRPLLKLAAPLKPLLPARLKKSVPDRVRQPLAWPDREHDRRVLLMEGCVQSVTNPQINAATARVLDRLGIQALPADGCCGALAQHLSDEVRTLAAARRNIDAWWPQIEAGAEAVLLTASGCVPTVLDYGRLLADDPEYADRAARLSELATDISVFFTRQDLTGFEPGHSEKTPIAFHSPCSLQHGLKRPGVVERLLIQLGFELTHVDDSHLCCGSAGSYSLLQPELSRRLLENKIRNLEAGSPAQIVTANIGCLQHLQSGTKLEIRHWIELLDRFDG